MKEQPKMKFVPKGWGWERWIVNKPEYCGKLLYLAKDKRCSLHYHKNKDETFYLKSGNIIVYYSYSVESILQALAFQAIHEMNVAEEILDKVYLQPGDNFHVPPKMVHMMVALQDSELFEFSTFHEDSDSYRLLKGD